MSLEGVVTNGTINLDDDARPPEGTRVEVAVKSSPIEPSSQPTLAFILKYAGTANDLPPDMAANHDHYLHGKPKSCSSSDLRV